MTDAMAKAQIHKEQSRFQKLESTCVLCGRCMAVCPILAVTGKEELGPRSKAHLAQELTSLHGELSLKKVRELASICLGCGRCAKVCTQGVNVPETIAQLKAKNPNWKDWVWKTILTSSSLFWPVIQKVKQSKHHAKDEIRPWIRLVFPQKPLAGERAVLFPGCTAKALKPVWQEKAQALAQSMTDMVLPMPQWPCCGFPFAQAGLFEEQQKSQLTIIEIWRSMGRPKIITFCATCGAGLNTLSQDQFAGDSNEYDQWKESIVSLTRLLSGAKCEVQQSKPERLGYHVPCHSQSIGTWLLSTLPDEIQRIHIDQCCGFGGSLQVINPKISKQITKDYWENVDHEHRLQLLTDCSGCVLQLQQTAPEGVQVGHWLEAIEIG